MYKLKRGRMKPYYICNWDNIVIIDDLEEAFGRDMVSIICVIHTAYWESDIIFNAAETSCNKAPAAAAKLLQSCPTLCDPIDGSPPGSPIPGILQARTLEWVAISFSNAGKWKVKVKSLSCVWLLATSWTAAYQAPPSMGFSRQEY